MNVFTDPSTTIQQDLAKFQRVEAAMQTTIKAAAIDKGINEGSLEIVYEPLPNNEFRATLVVAPRGIVGKGKIGALRGLLTHILLDGSGLEVRVRDVVTQESAADSEEITLREPAYNNSIHMREFVRCVTSIYRGDLERNSGQTDRLRFEYLTLLPRIAELWDAPATGSVVISNNITLNNFLNSSRPMLLEAGVAFTNRGHLSVTFHKPVIKESNSTPKFDADIPANRLAFVKALKETVDTYVLGHRVLKFTVESLTKEIGKRWPDSKDEDHQDAPDEHAVAQLLQRCEKLMFIKYRFAARWGTETGAFQMREVRIARINKNTKPKGTTKG